MSMSIGIAAGLEASSIDTLLTRCRQLVGHSKHSPKQTALLTEAAEELQLRHLSLIYLFIYLFIEPIHALQMVNT